jgi:hypothetical protein
MKMDMYDSILAAQGHGDKEQRKRYEQQILQPQVANGIYIPGQGNSGGHSVAP